MEAFKTEKDIQVHLISAPSRPYEISVASAKTCYSSRGIIYPEEVSSSEAKIVQRDGIAESTLEAGHLTTRQHAHFVFGIAGVSRQLIWSFLHSHPFYNSEQVSQRYVKIGPGNFFIPVGLNSLQKEIYERTVEEQFSTYEKLISVLWEPISQDFFERFPARKKLPEKWKSTIQKRILEIARYVLGVGTTSYLYHTVSALTLLRYAKLVELFDTSNEQKALVHAMLTEVKKWDPLFEKELRDPIPLEKTPEFFMQEQFSSAVTENFDFAKEFDQQLEGRVSKLISYSANAEFVLANAVRAVLGKSTSSLSREEAICLVLDPKKNPLLSDPLNPVTIDKLSQVLHHVQFTFQKKISHTADSQDQRHRMVTGSRPILSYHSFTDADYITPFGVTQTQAAQEIYQQSMEKSFRAVHTLLEMGCKKEWAHYLLPNAVAIRLVSTGDLQALQHKWKLRTCYNAQEEIFRASLEEISQVTEVFPTLAQHLRAPCYLRQRAGVKPYCPEGDRFCGLPVWKFGLQDYVRKSL